jgi:predicted outer membrane lipoprotein
MKKILSLALLLSVTASAFGVEAEINGLWYELVSNCQYHRHHDWKVRHGRERALHKLRRVYPFQ